MIIKSAIEFRMKSHSEYGLNVEKPGNLEGLTELGEGDSVGCSRNGVVVY